MASYSRNNNLRYSRQGYATYSLFIVLQSFNDNPMTQGYFKQIHLG